MEVAHHPDLHHKPKPWKEYFLEFLMIFLAVSMGFLAESLREHIVEKKREKEGKEKERKERRKKKKRKTYYILFHTLHQFLIAGLLSL